LITPASPVHNFDIFERTDFLTGVKFGWKLPHQRGQFWAAFNTQLADGGSKSLAQL
jgi:hypothetical protein